MNALDAAYEVLRDVGEPLHYRELTKRMLDQGLWTTRAKTPVMTVNARLAVDVQKLGEDSRFRRTAPGMYGLRDAGEPAPQPSGQMSFLDAAEEVLRSSGSREPMRYEAIMERAIAAGHLETEGKTPAVSLSSMVGVDIRRRQARGEPQRFLRPTAGMIALAEPVPPGLATEIDEHNRRVRAELLERIASASPEAFEALIEALLRALGFEDVERTSLTKDGGIDVRGTLVVGDVVRIRMAIQAKRWKGNVQRPEVQKVRGSLGAHEQGLIITTSDFTKTARTEAARADASPVALMNGEQFILLLSANEIGVHRERHELFSLDETWSPSQ